MCDIYDLYDVILFILYYILWGKVSKDSFNQWVLTLYISWAFRHLSRVILMIKM